MTIDEKIEEKIVGVLNDTVELYQDDKAELIKKLSTLIQKEREEAVRDACTHEYEKVGGNWDSYAVFICKKCGSEKVVDL